MKEGIVQIQCNKAEITKIKGMKDDFDTILH